MFWSGFAIGLWVGYLFAFVHAVLPTQREERARGNRESIRGHKNKKG